MSTDTQHSDIYWLNKDSRKFLQRGYLLEDETPEQRISDIAKTALATVNSIHRYILQQTQEQGMGVAVT